MTIEAPRDDLIRAVFTQRATVDGEGRTMTGYPIVFDAWTEINSWEGNFKERVAPGALTKTLKERGDQVKVLFNHGMDPQIGDKPLGKPSRMKPDATGLYVEVPLSRTSYNDDLIALMADEAIDGMSFRFSVVKESWDQPKRGLPERTIDELRLFEFGPVTFPAYQATTVGLRTAGDFARWRGLTDGNRSEIARLMGLATDLATPDDGAGTTITDEPPASGTPRSTRAARQQVVRRLFLKETLV